MIQFVAIDLPHSQKMEILEIFDWSNDLNAIQLGTFSDHLQSFKVPAGVTIFTEGDVHNFFCLLFDGHVDVIKENLLGKKNKIQSFGPGKSFGEMSFFDGEACSASVVARDDVSIFVIDKKNFEILCENSPAIVLQIAINIIGSISRRLRQTTGKLVDLL